MPRSADPRLKRSSSAPVKLGLPLGLGQILGLALAVISVLGFIGLATGDGIVAGAIGGALASLFGRPAWLAVLILLLMGVATFVSSVGGRRIVSASSVFMAALFLASLSGLSHLTTGLESEPSGRTGGGFLGQLVGWNLVLGLGYSGAYAVLIILIILGLGLALLRPASGLRLVEVIGVIVIRGIRSAWRLSVAMVRRLDARGAKSGGSPAEPVKQGASKRTETPITSRDDQWQQAPLIKTKSNDEPSEPAADGPVEVAVDDAQADGKWRLPPLELLTAPESRERISEDEISENAALLESTLASFGIEARVAEAIPGPVVTQYCLSPGSGVKVSKISSLANDLALALSAKSIRIEAPVPGRPYVGLELPNRHPAKVTLRELLESSEYSSSNDPLRLLMGKNVADVVEVNSLTAMPHLLIAGATGAGKSVFLNSVILSLLCQHDPDELRMILIDPKMVELVAYNDIPHLLMPVVVKPDEVVPVLAWASREMGRRYKVLSDAGYRNLRSYNDDADATERERLPFIVIIVDELADLMMTAPAEVERHLCRLAQMARAVGIHLVISTQRPSVDVLTGLIKANFPTRVAFMVSSQVDSRTILDTGGAERLIGQGDMLFSSSDSGKKKRLQGAYPSDSETLRITKFWADQGDSARLTHEEVAAAEEPEESELQLYEEAAEIVRRHTYASAALLQRELQIGATLARRLIDILEEQGVVGPPIEGRPSREVLKDEALEPEEVV